MALLNILNKIFKAILARRLNALTEEYYFLFLIYLGGRRM